MNKDIRLSVEFWDNPKTVKLERRLGLPAIKSLQVLWLWAAQNKADGLLSGMDIEDIEIAARWEGDAGSLVECLISLRWIDDVDGGLQLQGWEEHNPWASGSDERGDKARLSILFKKNPVKAKELKESGVTGITKEEYLLHVGGRSNNGRTTVVNDSFTPSPSPSPSPSPKTKKEEKTCPAGAEPSTHHSDFSQQEPPTPRKKQPATSGEDVSAVFAHWKSVMGHDRAKLDAKREKAIKSRLKDGYTVGELCEAVDGCRASPFHQGDNKDRTKYDDIELVCRDAKNVDKFRRIKADGFAGKGLSIVGMRTAAAAQRFVEKMGGLQE